MPKTPPKKEKLIAFGDYFLVSPDPEDSRENKYGVYTPNTVEVEKRAKGTVVSVGSDVKRVKKGDRIVHIVYGGELIKDDDGKEYRVLKEEDVCCFLA